MLFFKAVIGSLMLVAVRGDASCDKLANGVYPVFGDCSKFLTCADGVGTVADCPSTSLYRGMWSKSHKHCVYTLFPGCFIMNKYCAKLPTDQTTIPALRSISQDHLMALYNTLPEVSVEEQIENGFLPDAQFHCPDKNGHFAVENDPSGYRVCVRGQAFIGRCEKNETWDPITAKCLSEPDLLIDAVEGEYDCATSPDGVYGFSDNCKLFQVCCGGVETMHKCPINLRYDIFSRACTLRTLANCEP